MDQPSSNEESSALTLRIKFKSESGAQFIERYGADLSSGGIFIRSREPLSVGTALNFAFSLHDGSPLLGGAGTVVWIREMDVRRPNGGQPGMGIRFDRLLGDSQVMLARLLAEKARREREGGLIGSGGRPTPAPPARASASRPVVTTGERAALASDAAPKPIEAPEATARVEINPLTGEPMRPMMPPAAQPEKLAGEGETAETSRKVTPFVDAPIPTEASRPVARAVTPPPIRREHTPPPLRRQTPAMGEPQPRATQGGEVVRRPSSPPAEHVRRPTPARWNEASSQPRRPTPAPGTPMRRPTPVPLSNDTVRTRSPFPPEPGARWEPLDRPVAMSPLEGALSSTVGGARREVTPTPAGRSAPRTRRPTGEWQSDNEATELAPIPPELMAGATPGAAVGGEGSSGSSESRPTNPEIPMPRRSGSLVPAATAPGALGGGDLGPGPTTTMEVTPMPFSAPQAKSGGGKAIVIVGAAAAAVAVVGFFVLRGRDAAAPAVTASAPVTPPAPVAPAPATTSAETAPSSGANAAAPSAAPTPAAAAPAPAAPAAAAQKEAESPTTVPIPDEASGTPKPAAPAAKPVAVAAKPAAKPARVAVKPRRFAKAEKPAADEAPAAATPAPAEAPAPAPEAPADNAAAAAPDSTTAAAPSSDDIHWLVVRSTPAGADVAIDGEVEGKTPFQRRIFDTTRSYAVAIRKAGFESSERTVSSSDAWVKKGNARSLVVFAKLVKAKKGAAEPTAAPGAASDDKPAAGGDEKEKATEPAKEPEPAAAPAKAKDDPTAAPVLQ